MFIVRELPEGTDTIEHSGPTPKTPVRVELVAVQSPPEIFEDDRNTSAPTGLLRWELRKRIDEIAAERNATYVYVGKPTVRRISELRVEQMYCYAAFHAGTPDGGFVATEQCWPEVSPLEQAHQIANKLKLAAWEWGFSHDEDRDTISVFRVDGWGKR